MRTCSILNPQMLQKLSFHNLSSVAGDAGLTNFLYIFFNKVDYITMLIN